MHFRFNGDICIQLESVAVGLRLGSFLANFFVCSLEESTVPAFKDCLVHWKRYVDDIHAYIKPKKIDYVMKKLTPFLVQIIYEFEKDQRFSF